MVEGNERVLEPDHPKGTPSASLRVARHYEMSQGSPRAWRGLQCPPHRLGLLHNKTQGKNLKKTAKATGLVLLNEPGQATRIGAQAAENNASQDLTWTSRGLRSRWTVMADTRVSDHPPMKIDLLAEMRRKRDAPLMKWDNLRSAFEEFPNTTDLGTRIQTAMKLATSTQSIKEDDPDPDLHLLSLFASRLQAQQHYKRAKRNIGLRIKLTIATAKA